MKRSLFIFAMLSLLTAYAARVNVSVLAFDARGWKLDSQFSDIMGSPYLLAHGCGVRVLDARASVEIPESGTWHVWVRNRCWVKGAGFFKVAVNGRELEHVFGAGQSDWSWEDGGTVTLEKGIAVLSLVDKDGFDGRCAGIVLTNDGTVPEGPLVPLDEVAETIVSDFTVVGGGMPGTCAAVAAARRGLKVVLVQDRPVLGGNASAEIRVWCAGEARYPLVRELRSVFLNRDVNMPLCDVRRMRIVEDETNLTVRLLTRAVGVERRPDGTIAAVKALDLRRNRMVRFESPLFCDATGDGWIGYWAGADWRMGREAKAEHGESFAPEKADADTLGASIMWTSAVANAPVPFSAPWAEPFAQGETAVNGEWNWEYGIHRDMISEGEHIRDRLLLAIYGAFSRAKRLPENSNRMLNFCPFLLGKRESRRLLGDWIYSEKDVTEKRLFEDSIASGSWSVDLHYDDCKPGVDFLTTCRQPHYGRYWIPYRSIYSRNVGNLFMVGRCFSCTHVGLGGPRVINTLSQLGVVAGEAAAMCRRLGETPRGIFAHGHVRELQTLLGGGFPGVPDPKLAGWRIVDDESEGVTFGKGWAVGHNPNGEQMGDSTHFPEACGSWCPDLKQGTDIGDVVYPLPVEMPGKYVLMGRVPYFYKTYPGSSTAMVVSSSGRDTPFAVDQGIAAGSWRRLGVFDLAPGATLRIVGSRSHGTVAADGFAVVAADCRAVAKDADVLWTRVIAQEEGRQCSWPSVAKAADGSIIAVFSGDREAHICPWGKVQMVKSMDGGETWSEPRTIGKTKIDDRDAGIVLLPDGRLFVTWFNSVAYRTYFDMDTTNYPPGSAKAKWQEFDRSMGDAEKRENCGFYGIWSSDNGETWTKPEKLVTLRSQTPHGPILLKDGSLLQFGRRFDDNLKKMFTPKYWEHTTMTVERSVDGGHTWKTLCDGIPDSTGENDRHKHYFHEPHVAELPNRELYALIRADYAKDVLMRQTRSLDGGKTWEAITPTTLSGLPPHLLVLSDGRLLAVYGRRKKDRGGFGEYASISSDGGRTWGEELKLSGAINPDLGYPASIEVEPGVILTVYYQQPQTGGKPCIMATKWKLKQGERR